MDVRKLLQKVNLILEVENQHNLQGMFQNILTHYQGNESQNVKSQRDQLCEAVENSAIRSFVSSDLNTLKSIGVQGYFDMEAIERLDEMLSAPGYEVRDALTEFINKRAELVEKLNQLQSTLVGLDVQAEDVGDMYQFVLVFPNQYRNLGNCTTQSRRWSSS